VVLRPVNARPDFAKLTEPGNLFMARLAVLGSDRIAALFEAFPKGAGSATSCRRYFLAVLDAAGKLVSATQLSDPMLELCNHPHPYGVASDSVGNIFIMFSSTKSASAPLIPEAPSLLMSYSRDGVFRWKRKENALVGGELAVARGVLYPENCGFAFLASTGAPFSLPNGPASGLFGRVVMSSDRLIPSPIIGSTRLYGYELANGQPRWTYTLPGGDNFASDQIRLASWNTTSPSLR
jgi:hypothetical protein